MKICVALLLLFVAGCSTKADPPMYGTAPAFSFTERSGREVQSSELAGKVWVADFIFTSCAGACPVMTEKMRALQEKLPPEIRLVSFTVDPERDTPETLRSYAERAGADRERWLFLTGNKEALYKLSIEGFKLGVDDAAGTPAEPITHSTRFVLVDREGRIRGYYGMEDETALERLEEDATGLLH